LCGCDGTLEPDTPDAAVTFLAVIDGEAARPGVLKVLLRPGGAA
jgi:hypothetical protein